MQRCCFFSEKEEIEQCFSTGIRTTFLLICEANLLRNKGWALFTRDIFAHNIAIKRYCNKNIFLSHGSL